LVASTDIVGIEDIRKAIEKKFKGKSLERNLKAFELAHERTTIVDINRRLAVAKG